MHLSPKTCEVTGRGVIYLKHQKQGQKGGNKWQSSAKFITKTKDKISAKIVPKRATEVLPEIVSEIVPKVATKIVQK